MRIVHYINQFYAQIGGEEKADYPLEIREDAAVGPGNAFQEKLGSEAKIVATIICGDNFFNENLETVSGQPDVRHRELLPRAAALRAF